MGDTSHVTVWYKWWYILVSTHGLPIRAWYVSQYRVVHTTVDVGQSMRRGSLRVRIGLKSICCWNFRTKPEFQENRTRKDNVLVKNRMVDYNLYRVWDWIWKEEKGKYSGIILPFPFSLFPFHFHLYLIYPCSNYSSSNTRWNVLSFYEEYEKMSTSLVFFLLQLASRNLQALGAIPRSQSESGIKLPLPFSLISFPFQFFFLIHLFFWLFFKKILLFLINVSYHIDPRFMLEEIPATDDFNYSIA